MLTFQVSKEKQPIAYTKNLKEVEITAKKPVEMSPHCNVTFVYNNQVYRLQVTDPKQVKILEDAFKKKAGESDAVYESRVKKTMGDISWAMGEKLRQNKVSVENDKTPQYQDATWITGKSSMVGIKKGEDPVAYLQRIRKEEREQFGNPVTQSPVVKDLFKSFDAEGHSFTQTVVLVKSTSFVLDEGEFATTKENKTYTSKKLAAPDIMVEMVAPKPKSASPKP